LFGTTSSRDEEIVVWRNVSLFIALLLWVLSCDRNFGMLLLLVERLDDLMERIRRTDNLKNRCSDDIANEFELIDEFTY